MAFEKLSPEGEPERPSEAVTSHTPAALSVLLSRGVPDPRRLRGYSRPAGRGAGGQSRGGLSGSGRGWGLPSGLISRRHSSWSGRGREGGEVSGPGLQLHQAPSRAAAPSDPECAGQRCRGGPVSAHLRGPSEANLGQAPGGGGLGTAQPSRPIRLALVWGGRARPQPRTGASVPGWQPGPMQGHRPQPRGL